jgi:hypothetical protein
VRLGTCIALEIVTGLVAIAATSLGTTWAVTEVQSRTATTNQAHAAISSRRVDPPEPVAAPAAVPLAAPVLAPEPVVAPPAGGTIWSFAGQPDESLLDPIRTGKLVRVKFNRGGSSLSLRLEFDNGARAAFKPEQTFLQSNPRREIAAYRLDRLLGIGRVPPAKAIAIPLDELLAATEPSHRRFITERFAEEGIVRDGIVRGEVSWWLPEIRLAKLGPHLIDEPAGKDTWTAYLQIGATIPPNVRPLVEQVAQIVLFDVLIDNPDRWTGGNTMMSPDGTVLYFMDNTMSFSRFAYGHKSNLLALRRIQVFPRRLVERLRTLTADQIVAALGTDAEEGLAPLLAEDEVRALLTRRDNMLRHIDELIARHGEDAVLALP